ncbi:MAG: glycosyltransferase family 4 protein [Candidatus Yanofskybacteria bacterium]|nr:glycosyltransferase family 4 protein [Candidatus Yanofskybacteria bacterium]
MPEKSSKIVLATGIFFPDVGGPAIHVRKIAEALHQDGWRVVVVSYGDYDGQEQFPFRVIRISNKLNPFLRRTKYLLTIFKEAISARTLYAFNLATAGLPVFIVGKMLVKKILIRVPGDPIWERIVERGQRLVSFADYYKQGLYLADRPWLFRIIKFVLPKFDKIVFYTPFLSDIYQKFYKIPAGKITIIPNPVFRRQPLNVELGNEPTVLFAGRFVAYKNLELVIMVFDRVRVKLNKGRLILIGAGPDKEKLEKIITSLPSAGHIEIIPKINQDKLFEYICSSWVGIGPALTEFNPNFILECLSLGKPVLLSRENGLSVKLPDEFLFDPQNEQEFQLKMSQFFNAEFYKRAKTVVDEMALNQTWDKVINSHRNILEI